MIPATRIARRIVRKITKPIALWWTTRKIRRAIARVMYFERLLGNLVPKDVKHDVIKLIAKRNEIQSW